MSRSFVVRPVQPADLPAVGRLAGQLVRYHYALDPKRYMLIENVEEGYAHFLGREATNPRAVVLCAAEETAGGDSIVGYAYGTLEGRDWNALLEPHGALHDVLVDPAARRSGIAAKLVLEVCSRLETLGAPRVLLHTAVQNEAAQSLFAKLGFRTTMLEMTRERGGT
jgi:ribosomal protein S18 acetylase RimI-like enzyme